MTKRFKVLALFLAIVLMASVPGIAGCGGSSDGDKTTILIGILTDFTGTSASAQKPTVDAMMDYVLHHQETEPIPGVKIKFTTYDTRLDYAKVVPGYTALKERGAVMMHVINPSDRNILADRLAADKMVVMGSQETMDNFTHPWMFNYYAPMEVEAEAMLTWIMNTWDYGTESDPKPAPKIGHIGWTLDTTKFLQAGIESTIAANPGKFQWVGLAKAPPSTTTWTSEVNALKSSDYILFSIVASPMATFVRDARNLGYTGALVSGVNSFPGYWDLTQTMVDKSKMTNCYYVAPWPWWSEDCDYIDDLKESIARTKGQVYVDKDNSGPVTGLGMGIMMDDVIRRAIAAVGVENLDGDALREAALAINLDVDGFGNTWKVDENGHFLCRTFRAHEYDPDSGKWVPTVGLDEYFSVASLEE